MCVDQYSEPYKICFGEGTIGKFLNDMIKESGYCSKIIKTKFNKTIVMTKKDHGSFENSTKYWICKKEYEEVELKVKDHDHVTGKY